MAKKFTCKTRISNISQFDPSNLGRGAEGGEGQAHGDSAFLTPMDLRLKNLSFDMEVLAKSTWIKRLYFERDIPIPEDEFVMLRRLGQIEDLSIKEFGTLDYSEVSAA